MPQITLTRGAAARLAQFISTAGLLTDQAKLFRIGEFNENYLADMEPAPAQPGADGKPADFVAWQKASISWARDCLPPIDIKERVKDALKDLVQAAANRNLLSGSISDVALLRSLGLSPED